MCGSPILTATTLRIFNLQFALYIVVHGVKPLFTIPTSHIGTLVRELAVLFTNKLPANVPVKGMEDGPSAWACYPLRRALVEFLISGFSLALS